MADRWHELNRRVIAEFRSNGGAVGGEMAGLDIAILTMTGAKSGQPRQVPLVYDRDGDRLVVIASKAGAPSHPDWYYNLVANPAITVETSDETYRGLAREAVGDERDRLFAAMAPKVPHVGDMQRANPRTFPVFTIERAG